MARYPRQRPRRLGGPVASSAGQVIGMHTAGDSVSGGAELGVGLTAAPVSWLVVNRADEPVMPTMLPA